MLKTHQPVAKSSHQAWWFAVARNLLDDLSLSHLREFDLTRLPCRPSSCCAAVALLAASSSAFAGTLSGGGWLATGCGPKPVAPVVELKNVDAYNASIGRVNAYLPLLKSHVDCVTQEANGDLKSVSQSANAVQAEAREARERILADVKAAEEKFK